MRDPETSAREGLYRDGGKLVLREGVEFPDRCAICNKESDGEPIRCTFERVKVPYIEIAVVQTVATAALDLIKGAKYTGPVVVAISLCSWHRNRLLRHILLGVLLMALAVGYIFIRYSIGGAREFQATDSFIYIFFAGLVGVFGLGMALATAYDPTPVWFRPKKFYDRFVWVEGAGREFLRTLPLLNGEREGTQRTRMRRSGSKTRDADPGGSHGVDEVNLSAEELIRRARRAGVNDED